MQNSKLTKIVATIGPATETEEMLTKLIQAGVNVTRFNTKHGTPEWHHERILRVRKVAKELDTAVAVLLDLQGPEIRINLPDGESFDMEKGDKAFFSFNEDLDKENLIIIPENVVKLIEPGQLIITDDGLCHYQAVDTGKDYIVAEALDSFTVKHRKTMSVPGLVTDMPVLIENDYVQLDGIQDNEVDFVALSFVRNKADVLNLREELKKRKLTAGIVAKIENQSAIDNIEEIIEASDAVMIARGDLGVEVPYEELIHWQRKMIQLCREQAKPVITATHMLETMIENPVPTRAEVSDVAHAIYDRTDAVMLSGETTIGKYPVKSVEVQAKVSKFNEQYVETDLQPCAFGNQTSIAHSAAALAVSPAAELDAVICLTETGKTASLLAKHRPTIPVHVVTATEEVYRKLALTFSVIPHLVDWPEHEELLNADSLIKKLGKVDWLKSGEKVLVVHGPSWREAGETNTLSIVEVK